MGRKVAVAWHASFSIAAGVLYFFFVLPRWPELTGSTTPHAWHGAAHRHGRSDRPGGAAGGVHAAADPQARAGHPAAGAEPADVVDRAARAGGRADRRDRDQRDLAQPGQRRALAVRHLRCRRGDRAARHLRVLPGVRGRDAAASAQTAQAEGGEETAVAGAARPRKTRTPTRRTPRNSATTDEATADDDEPSEAEAPAESERAAERGAGRGHGREARGRRARGAESVPETDDSDELNGSESTNGGLRNRRASGKIALRKRKRSRGGVAVDD